MMTLSAIRRSLDDLGSRLFQRDHPERRWRASRRGAGPDGASAEERALYRGFAAGWLRERAAERAAAE